MPLLEVEITSSRALEPSIRLDGNSSDCERCLAHALTPNWCEDSTPSCASTSDSLMRPNASFFFELSPAARMTLLLRDVSEKNSSTSTSTSHQESLIWRLDQLDLEPLVQYKLQVHFPSSRAEAPQVHFVQTPMARDWLGLTVAGFVLVCALAFVRTTTNDIERPKWRTTSYVTIDAMEMAQDSAKPLIESPSETSLEQPAGSHGHKSISRFASLDIFRGITMCAMVFVNYGGEEMSMPKTCGQDRTASNEKKLKACGVVNAGGGYRFFSHSIWNGLTLADVVFPWFAWIMGFSLFLSHAHKSPSARTITWRSLKLVVLGLFLNQSKSLEEWRFPGVLQALGFAFFVVSMVFQWSGHQDLIARVRFCGVCACGIGLLNLGVVFFLPVKDCPRGYIGPGGFSDFGKFANCTGGAHLVVDRALFGEKHLYQTPTIRPIYHTGPFDPEGFLNMLMITVTCFFGFFTASSVKRHNFLLMGGVLTIGIAEVLHHVLGIPMNKNLWSLSYVLCTTGLACLVLCVCTILDANPDDILECDGAWKSFRWTVKHWIGQVLARVGRNAIGIYVLHEVCTHVYPFALPANVGLNTREDHLLTLICNASATLWWVGVACWMHSQHVYIRL